MIAASMIARIVDDAGGPSAPLIYLPGVDGTGELLLGTAARLIERFRLIRLRYELVPGTPLVGDGYAELAGSVGKCLDRLEVERTLVLAESFGVGVALRLALEQPERVAGLALVNGFAHYEGRLRMLVASVTGRLLPPALFALGRRLFGPRLFGPRLDKSTAHAFLQVSSSVLDADYRRRLAMIRRLDLRDRLGDVRTPVALFASDRDSVVNSVRAARHMAELLPDATLEVLPRSGHLVLPLADEPWVERLTALAARAGLTPGASRVS